MSDTLLNISNFCKAVGVPYLSSTVSSVVLSVELCGGAGVNEGEQGRQRSTVQWTVDASVLYCTVTLYVKKYHSNTNPQIRYKTHQQI